ncbi:MAG: penicillin acylase family protein [Pyrinomonadaceae bacterium]
MKALIFVIFIVLSFLSIPTTAQISSAKINIDGIKNEVAIRRDARGIPYIEAKSDADLYFAQGYVTASDRLWQMDLLRRLARGETAEIFGGSVLEEDKRWRRFGFAEVANQSLNLLTPELRTALQDYARGVNAFIASLDETSLPVEFRILQYKPKPWAPTDTIVIGKILADALSTTWQNDLLRSSLKTLSPEKFADLTNQVTPYDVILFGKDLSDTGGNASVNERAPNEEMRSLLEPHVIASTLKAVANDSQLRADSLARVGLYSEDLAASNNWVISGKRTADGKPILANDPHLQPSAPGIWYMSQLSTPTMRVSGVTFPGVPGIVLGHNEFIAWGATNVGPDVQDIYYETFNAEGQYRTPTGWEKPTVRKEKIQVRINPLKTDTRIVDYDVTETRNGVIMIEDSGKKYALKWTARDPKNNEFESFFAFNRARNWNDFKNALKTYGGATQNFVYADVKGNIGWYAAGRIPLRKTGDGSLPYDGSTNDGEWIGNIPFDELPNLYNPPSGLIVTANQRIVGTSYKYPQISRAVAPPWRVRRIYDALNAKTKITIDDVRDVQYDAYNIPLANLAKEIVKFGAASSETIKILKNWDGNMTADSTAALLVNEIMGCVASRMNADLTGVPTSAIRERIVDWAVREKSPRWLPKEFKNYNELLQSCDSQKRTELSNRYGSDPSQWHWGKTWQSRFPHPLAAVPLIGSQFATPNVPLNGSGQTPNVGSHTSMRFIAIPGNWDTTRLIISLGESGDPKSTHYKDQFEAWRTGSPAILPFTKVAVEKATTSVTVMSPK